MRTLFRPVILVIAIVGTGFAASAARAPVDPARPAAAAPVSPREQIAELRREIARHDELYFRHGTPEISDFAYDQLRRRLAQLESAFPDEAKAVASLPPVPDDRTGLFPSLAHRQRMLSLEKCDTEAGLRTFDARLRKALGRGGLEYVIEPKYDGLAVNVTFENGRLVRALTRGNGDEGEDITEHVREITGMPSALVARADDSPSRGMPRIVELRGEIHVPFAEFARINGERELAGEPRYTHPRALAVAAIRQGEVGELTRRGLRVVFFGIGTCEPDASLPSTQRELHAWLRGWGLSPVANHWFARGPDELVQAVESLRRARDELGYPIDGCVVKIDAWKWQRELGEGEAAPRWAIAYKYAPERAETQLLAISVQVGRTGVLTPVAELAPVELAGSTIRRATLHNRDEIARRDIRVGDYVLLEKAGDVIPAVVGVNLERRPAVARPYAFPDTCPSCNAPLTAEARQVAVRCGNVECPAQIRRRIEHFASKSCADIAGLGPAAVEALVQSGRVRGVADLYRLRPEDVRLADGNAIRSADELLAAIAASKRADLSRFIHGLGIPGVGATTARDLARRFPTLDALVNARGSDPATRAVESYFVQPRNRAVVADLIAAGVRPDQVADTGAGSTVTGKTFALTGTLPSLSRAEATALIHAAGGRTSTGVSRTTNYLVAGPGAGAKLDQARQLGVAIIDESELRRLLAEPAAAQNGGR